jgi:hypothetical protein
MTKGKRRDERVESRRDGKTLLVRIPLRSQRWGGRKRIVAPDGSAIVPASKPQPDGTLLNKLARVALAATARWRRVRLSVSDIGDAENIFKSYVSRILRLALLAPDMVEAIIAGSTDQVLMLEQLEQPLPASWEQQRGRLLSTLKPWSEGCGRSRGALPVSREQRPEPDCRWPQGSEFRLLFLGLCFRRTGLRFSERTWRSSGRRENLLLVSLGLLGLAIAPLLTFRHRRPPSRSSTRSHGQ